ncbi:thioesterase II family protein [Tsukamurella serpentis]
MAGSFQRWQRLLGDRVDVRPLDYPGRAARDTETPVLDAQQLARDVARHVLALGPARTILFGHSMGAWMAYEAALLLQRAESGPAGLIVSGAPAPRHAARREPHGRLDDERLRAKCLDWGGTPVELLDDPAFREQAFPHLRADLQAIDSYVPTVDGVVEAPMIALAGREDNTAPAREVAGWADHARTWRGNHIVPGGHFFLSSAEDVVVRLVWQHCRTSRSPIGTVSGDNQ